MNYVRTCPNAYLKSHPELIPDHDEPGQVVYLHYFYKGLRIEKVTRDSEELKLLLKTRPDLNLQTFFLVHGRQGRWYLTSHFPHSKIERIIEFFVYEV